MDNKEFMVLSDLELSQTDGGNLAKTIAYIVGYLGQKATDNAVANWEWTNCD